MAPPLVAGEGRVYGVPVEEWARPGGDDLRHVGPRADEAHVALEHVEELRQFVHRRLAEQPADAGDVGVAPAGAEQPLLQVAPGNALGDVALDAVDHGAELVEAELPAAEADALLTEQRRAGRIELDEGVGEGPDGPE